MKLLHANDQTGIHAPSWYASLSHDTARPSLQRHKTADVCVIGAGYTGLAAAIRLAELGRSVIVVDAHRIGWGASGRNGGQLGSGFNSDQYALVQRLGLEKARRLWTITENAKSRIHNWSDEHQLAIDYRPGIVQAQHRQRFVKPLHDYCRYLNVTFGYDQYEPLDQSALRTHLASEAYYGGAIDHGAGHINPLQLACGMANIAEKSGATIHERSEVLRITTHSLTRQHRIVTAEGSILCESVVLACNGYLDALCPPINRYVMPINNFIVVTERLGQLASDILPSDKAAADSRFVINYFRRVDGDRLLFGGGENYSYRFPDSISQLVRRAMLQVFPALESVGIDYAWGGSLAITRNRLPYVAELSASMYSAGGYSGHGIALATECGTAIADRIAGDSETFDILAELSGRRFPGNGRGRSWLLAGAMTMYSWLDKL